MEAFILIGGQSRRFGSNKSIAKFGSETFSEILFNRLQSQFDKVTIVGKIQYHTKLPFLPDKMKIQCPMSGIYSGLKETSSLWSFFMAVDMPLIGKEIIDILIKNIRDEMKVIVPTVNGRFQPLCALYHKSLSDVLEKYLTNGNLRLTDFIKNCSHLAVNVNKYSKQLHNVNTLEDFEKLKTF